MPAPLLRRLPDVGCLAYQRNQRMRGFVSFLARELSKNSRALLPPLLAILDRTFWPACPQYLLGHLAEAGDYGHRAESGSMLRGLLRVLRSPSGSCSLLLQKVLHDT